MIELFREPNFDFIGRRRWAYIITMLFILAGIGSMVAKGGLRYGIDFSGGTLIQVRFDKAVSVDRIRHALETVQMGESVIQEFGDTREYLLRLPLAALSSEEVTRRTQEALTKDPELGKHEVRRVEFVGPQVGRDLQLQALYAVLAGMAGILIYVAIRFDFRGGVISIVAIAGFYLPASAGSKIRTASRARAGTLPLPASTPAQGSRCDADSDQSGE